MLFEKCSDQIQVYILVDSCHTSRPKRVFNPGSIILQNCALFIDTNYSPYIPAVALSKCSLMSTSSCALSKTIDGSSHTDQEFCKVAVPLDIVPFKLKPDRPVVVEPVPATTSAHPQHLPEQGVPAD